MKNLAKKAKRKVRRQIKKSNRTSVKQNVFQKVIVKVGSENKKVNYSLYIAFFVVLAFVLVVVYIAGNLRSPTYGGTSNENQTTNNPQTETRTSIGGFCKKDSECFINYCKGQSKDCINSTQMATYSVNCKSYSDWVVENTQDPSVCACSQNYCTMLNK